MGLISGQQRIHSGTLLLQLNKVVHTGVFFMPLSTDSCDLANDQPMQVSKLQKEVCEALIGMGVSYVSEDTSSGYAVDIAVPQLRIAVEIDGPYHFARTDTERPLGPTALKRRQLEKMGWHVLSITLDDWQAPTLGKVMLQDLRALIQDRQEDLN